MAESTCSAQLSNTNLHYTSKTNSAETQCPSQWNAHLHMSQQQQQQQQQEEEEGW